MATTMIPVITRDAPTTGVEVPVQMIRRSVGADLNSADKQRRVEPSPARTTIAQADRENLAAPL